MEALEETLFLGLVEEIVPVLKDQVVELAQKDVGPRLELKLVLFQKRFALRSLEAVHQDPLFHALKVFENLGVVQNQVGKLLGQG